MESSLSTPIQYYLWADIILGTLIGSFEPQGRLEGQTFLRFMQNSLPALLEKVFLTCTEIFMKNEVMNKNCGNEVIIGARNTEESCNI